MPPGTVLNEDLEAPAYTRGLTTLTEFKRSQAIQAADREDANNRNFNRQFWATMASEAGGVPSGITTAKVGRWMSKLTGRPRPGG